MGLLVYKCVNGIAPSYLCNVLTPVSSVQTRESSNENLLYICTYHTSTACDLFKQSFEYRAPALWNFLPSHPSKAASVNDFKNMYKGTIFLNV